MISNVQNLDTNIKNTLSKFYYNELEVYNICLNTCIVNHYKLKYQNTLSTHINNIINIYSNKKEILWYNENEMLNKSLHETH